MAWCSRTSRSQNPPGVGHATTAAIGPGSYNTAIGGGSSSKPPKPSFAAFGSSGLKDAYPELPLHTPGPGAYATTSPAAYSVPRGEPVSSMFKSSTERTKFKSASAAPGPGAYAAAHPSAFKKSKAASAAKAAASSMRRSQSDHTTTNKHNGGGIKWVRVPTAPSIPNVAQSFGYEEGPKGQMILQHPTRTGHSGCANDVSGPGEYDPLTAIHRLACTRATSFAKSKTSRDQKPKAASAPGPGFYHPEDHDHHAAVQSAVFKSTLTRERATNPMTRRTASSAVPGPGSYNAAATPLGQNAKKPEHLQFFGSTTSRFDAVKKWGSSSPCPSSTSTPFKSQSHHRNQHNIGFTSTNKRFVDTSLAREMCDVGPGTYHASGLVEELQHRVSGRTGVFGSTTKRFESPMPASVLQSVLESSPPRPSNQQDDKGGVPVKSSAFASATSRFQNPATKDAVPCPGDYEVAMTWDKPGGKAVFASHLDRGSALDKKSAAMPGPGSYAAPDSMLKSAKPTTQRKDVFVSTVFIDEHARVMMMTTSSTVVDRRRSRASRASWRRWPTWYEDLHALLVW
ncbi:hypothetical protein, variant 1 [Aphanomyces astaci]|uniref:Uncharacterized protein n=1 Tax=Aphanomyces astaci TaxID=112090 RepID=W4FSR9_APHAT|nr:hypothetical protein, variant 1 [Aphanomyces astaci]ETV69673.1 hypothetical protein, variant 1 [Aphanomyces astaci]|eukprot:XP_009840889.1 hypothetical protein, variant 1 [Aphanomyces astaci]